MSFVVGTKIGGSLGRLHFSHEKLDSLVQSLEFRRGREYTVYSSFQVVRGLTTLVANSLPFLALFKSYNTEKNGFFNYFLRKIMNFFTHNHEAGVSVGATSAPDGRLRVAVAIRNPKDTPNRRVAVALLRERLKSPDESITFESQFGPGEFIYHVRSCMKVQDFLDVSERFDILDIIEDIVVEYEMGVSG